VFSVRDQNEFRIPLISQWQPWKKLAVAYAVMAVAVLAWRFMVAGKSGPPNPFAMWLGSFSFLLFFWVLMDLFTHEYGARQAAAVSWVSVAAGSFLSQLASGGLVNSLFCAGLLGGLTFWEARWVARRHDKRLASLPPPPHQR